LPTADRLPWDGNIGHPIPAGACGPQLEPTAVARDQNREAGPLETDREDPVRGDDPRALADSGREHGRVSATLRRHYRIPTREPESGRRLGHAPGDETLEFLERRGRDDQLRSGAKPIDLRLERETGTHR